MPTSEEQDLVMRSIASIEVTQELLVKALRQNEKTRELMLSQWVQYDDVPDKMGQEIIQTLVALHEDLRSRLTGLNSAIAQLYRYKNALGS